MAYLLIAAYLVLITACSPSQETPASQKASDLNSSAPPQKSSQEKSSAKAIAEIQWFQGSIEQAFAEAKQQNTPLFLYWGAAWCPPCNQLKATVFKRPDFIQQTRFFIPVYLDGDTENAQRYGEKFVIKGYPTLIVFTPQGEEITRIPGTMELSRYQKVLQISLQKLKPVGDIVKLLTSDTTNPSTLKREDYQLLAYYAWQQDHQQTLAEKEVLKVLHTLYQKTPERYAEEKSRLFMSYFSERIKQHFAEIDIAENTASNETALIPDAAFRKQAQQQLLAILSKRELILANAFALRYEDGQSLQAISVANSEARKQLIAAWRTALNTIAKAQQLSKIDRLGALYADISMDYLENNGELSTTLKHKIETRVGEARQSIANRYEHSAVLNMIRNVLAHAKMPELATQIISEEVENSNWPFYLLLQLASFAEEEGNAKQALVWYQQAYDKSQGRATRFQWGVSYLLALINLTPQNKQGITSQARELVNYLGTHQDAFDNRNKQRLTNMNEALVSWAQQFNGQQQLSQLRTQVNNICKQLSAQPQAQHTCQQMLQVANTGTTAS